MMDHKNIIIAIAFVSLFCASISDAKTLYVNGSTGNDSTTYANNSEANPWATLQRATWGTATVGAANTSEAAQAGDTVLVAAGTYTANRSALANNRWTVTFNPANSGSSGNLITFQADGAVTLQHTNGNGPIIGAAERNYIVWDGFYIDEANALAASDTGPVIVTGDYCQLLNLEIKGNDPEWEDNHNGIRLEGANHTTIRNCKIYDVAERGYGENAAAIMMYDSDDSIIENNEFYNCGAGVFVKGIHDGQTQANNIIRKNLIYSMGHSGIRVLGSQGSLVYQNIIHSSSRGLHIGFFDPTDDLLVNNTIYNCTYGIVPQNSDMVNEGVYNNIVYGGTHAIYFWADATPATQDIAYSRNIYYGQSSHHALYNAEGTPLQINFSQWQSTWGMDVDGANADPLFTNAGAGDFTLQAGSPALTLGRTITAIHGSSGQTIPAGAYITGDEVIGIDSEGGNGGNGDPPPSGTVQNATFHGSVILR